MGGQGGKNLAAHTCKMQEEEDDLDAEAEVTDAITELEEFMMCGAEINNDLAEGCGGNVPVPPPVFETVAFPVKQTTVSTLKDIAKAINVQYTGTKKVLWE
jgi:hypothetical protein